METANIHTFEIISKCFFFSFFLTDFLCMPYTRPLCFLSPTICRCSYFYPRKKEKSVSRWLSQTCGLSDSFQYFLACDLSSFKNFWKKDIAALKLKKFPTPARMEKYFLKLFTYIRYEYGEGCVTETGKLWDFV